MTRDRLFGSDVPFCDWMRKHHELPSYSPLCGFVATDCDVIIHRYLTCVDKQGTRDIQAIMMLEIKTRNGELPESQRDTLARLNCFRKQRGRMRFYGVSIVQMSGTRPDDSERIRWGRFSGPCIEYRVIDVSQLLMLLRFELHPDNLEPQPFRRHHRTRKLIVTEQTPLGFEVERPYIIRS